MQERTLPVSLLLCAACAACAGATTPSLPSPPALGPREAGDPNVLNAQSAARIAGKGCVVGEDASVWCFSDGTQGWTQVSGRHGWARFEATLGLQADGSLWCANMENRWDCGADPNSTDASATLARIFPDKTWQGLSQGGGFSCGLDANAALWCWGDDAPPSQPQPGTAWTQLASPTGLGLSHAIDANGQLFGLAHDPGASAFRLVPTPAAPGPWLSFSGACGVARADDANRLLCLRTDNGNDSLASPTGAAQGWRAADGSLAGGCAIADDGTLWCWGANGYGQLGNGQAGSLVPATGAPTTRIGDGNRWVAVGSPTGEPCAIQREAGRDHLYCWGANLRGQVAQPVGGYRDANSIGGAIPGAASWRTAATGHGAACAIGDDTSLWCWGAFDAACALNPHCAPANPFDYPLALTPSQAATSGWVDVRVVPASGDEGGPYACGLQHTADGNALWCWGQGAFDWAADFMPMQQLASGVDWGALAVEGGTLAAISADGNNLSAIRVRPNSGAPGVLRLANPTAQGRWIDANIGGGSVWAIWRDETAQPPTQHVLRSSLAQGSTWSLGYDGDWAHLGTLHNSLSGLPCGIKVDGTLWCDWIGLVQAQTGAGAAAHEPWTSFVNAAGDGYGVQGGVLWKVRTPLAPVQLAASIPHWQRVVAAGAGTDASVCGLYMDAAGQQQLTCWGSGDTGQLGVSDGVHGPALFYTRPQRMPF